MTELYDEASVERLLRARGLVDGPVTVTSLGGGVSNTVLAVDAPGLNAVFKQSLPRLRVAEEWLASQERTVAEAAAIELCAGLLPSAVPGLIAADPAEYWLLMQRAPAGWSTWKERLLAGVVDVATAERLGSILAELQNATRGGEALVAPLRQQRCFRELRIDPYYGTIATRHPALAPAIERAADRLLDRPLVLVHGDFSPKNILVGGPEPWVIDFEVAHLGVPEFDVAFVLSHLFLKGIRAPHDRSALAAASLAFWDSYAAAVSPDVRPPWSDVDPQLCCLVLARVDGKSPVEYLTAEAQDRVRDVARSGLEAPAASLAAFWERGAPA